MDLRELDTIEHRKPRIFVDVYDPFQGRSATIPFFCEGDLRLYREDAKLGGVKILRVKRK